MEIGVGLDGTLGLTFEDEAELSREAARLGYESVWTPEGPGYDAFQVCLNRWAASRDESPAGLGTGISVSPVALRTPLSLAMSGGTLSALTGGKFTLGIGSGGLHRRSGRRPFGLPDVSAIEAMREYVTTVRALVRGETVTVDGTVAKLSGIRLGIQPPPNTPVFLGALGPRMLQLAGESADGAALNWCSAERVAWSREQVSAAAEAAGRDPSEVKLAEYIRVCVDEDEDAARLAVAKATLGYAMGPRGDTARGRRFAYRGHFERMGFADDLAELDRMRDAGASRDELAGAAPAEMLLTVAYFGKADGAPQALARLSRGLDTAMVRVVNARPGPESVLTTMRACRPELIRQAAG